jgi:cytoskeletal protein RodZ
MDSFGEYLKRERELRGITLDEISKSSNISKTYLKYLESDDFENLPADVFVKGFIRCYAQNTGMDDSEAILAYNSFIANKRASQATSENSTETSTESDVKISYFWAIAIFVVLSSFLLVLINVSKDKEEKPAPVSDEKFSQGIDEIDVEESKNNIGITLDSNTTEKESLIKPEDMEVQPQQEGILEKIPPPSPSTESEGTPETSEETPETSERTDILILTMEATEDAWIALEIDGVEKKEALLQMGETTRWKAKEKFVVTLGNAAGTHLKLNEKDITMPETSSNIIRDFSITLDNINLSQ